MNNTAYVGLSHQMALRRQLDVVANNIANMNTTAFKSESVMFSEFLQKTTPSMDRGARALTMVSDVGLNRNVDQGQLVPTGNLLDTAIRGRGFFTLLGPDGRQLYTRNGHFELNGEGALVSAAGHPLLDSGGNEIVLDPSDTTLSIAADGTITTSFGVIGRINLVEFAGERLMRKVGNGMFETDQEPLSASNASIEQGLLESSNVTPLLEMTRMIEILRTYQSTTKLIQQYESLQLKTINKLGSFS